MDYAQQQRDPAKHLLGITTVALLHVFIVYALVTGLARKVVDVIKKPIETKIVEEAKPPPPPPTTTPPPPVAAIAPQPPPTAHVPVRVAPIVDVGKTCPSPTYPPASQRAEETGTVELRFLIDVDGRVIKSEVVRTSGHKRLDEAARAAIGACKFTPGTVDGKPEQSWKNVAYVWKLE
jgi:protein TonB